MSKSNLAIQVQRAIETESLAEFIRANLIDGKNLSIRGVAGLCGVSPQSILEGSHFKSAKLGQKLTEAGFEAAHLTEHGFPPIAVWLTIEYFAYESKAKAEYAKAIARTFGSLGVRAAFKEVGELSQAPVVQLLPVPTAEERVNMIRDAYEFFDLQHSPRHLQLARDRVALLMGEQTVLPPNIQKWHGVAEIAEQLDYLPSEILKVRSGLGKTIAAWFRNQYGIEPKTEERIVNGRICQLKVYQRTPDLDAAIHGYFA